MFKKMILVVSVIGSNSAFASVPELSGGAAATGIMLLIGGVLLFVDWKNGKRK